MEIPPGRRRIPQALDRADDTTHLNGWVSRAMAVKHAHQDALLPIAPRLITWV